jgi:hypothetical protein
MALRWRDLPRSVRGSIDRAIGRGVSSAQKDVLLYGGTGLALAGGGALAHHHYKKTKKASALVFFSDELEKISEWDSKKFREGLVDEGIPLAGATIGARYGGLRGAALGYAAGGTASLARSYAKGEKPSMSRKLLAAGALGYGAGGGAHALLEHATKGAKAGKGILGKIRSGFHAGAGSSPKLRRTVEEALPATGATLATGVAMGTSGSKKDKEKKAMSGMGAAVRAARPSVGTMIGSARQAAFGAGRTAAAAPARRMLQGNPTNFVPPTPAGGSSWANNPRAISI